MGSMNTLSFLFTRQALTNAVLRILRQASDPTRPIVRNVYTQTTSAWQRPISGVCACFLLAWRAGGRAVAVAAGRCVCVCGGGGGGPTISPLAPLVPRATSFSTPCSPIRENKTPSAGFVGCVPHRPAPVLLMRAPPHTQVCGLVRLCWHHRIRSQETRQI